MASGTEIGTGKGVVRGSCLCGAIRYETGAPAEAMGHCHCPMCRKQHGAAFATYARFPSEELRLAAGEDALQSYESSPDVQRQFCGICGSSLFFRDGGEPDKVWIAAGTLDDNPGVRPGGHIFVGSKAPWFEITDALPQHEAYG